MQSNGIEATLTFDRDAIQSDAAELLPQHTTCLLNKSILGYKQTAINKYETRDIK